MCSIFQGRRLQKLREEEQAKALEAKYGEVGSCPSLGPPKEIWQAARIEEERRQKEAKENRKSQP